MAASSGSVGAPVLRFERPERSRLFALVALGLTLFASPVAAQHTGGSFGSSSWGSSRSSSSSSSSSSYGGSSSWSSSSSRSSSRSSSWSSSSSSPSSSSGYSGSGVALFPDVDFELSAADKFLFFFVVIVVLFFVVVGKERGWWPFSADASFSHRTYDEPSRALATHRALAARRFPSATGAPPRATPPSPAGHAPVAEVLVMQVSVGMAASARRRLQLALTTMAQRASFDGAEGRARVLREVLAMLDEDGAARVYAGVGIEGHHAPMLAQRTFTRLVADLRSRYRHELIRNHDGVRSEREGPEVRAHADEGEGLVVVSLVVAAEGAFAPARHYEAAVAALRALPASSIIALEVIWSPAAEDDRMSSVELEVLYPELRRVSEGVGRVLCACGAPYAAELPRCPSCGRPKNPFPTSTSKSWR